jgi:hypothetical protein
MAPSEPQNGSLMAAANCYCAGSAYGNGPGGFAGYESYGVHLRGVASSNVDCASNYCQTWIWSVGHSVCSTYNLYGSGGVLLNWYWYYQSWSENLIQPYACDDLP